VSVPAVVTAGDGSAAKAVYGHSKVFLELGGRPLVAHVVAVLQRVPEVSEVLVVGNPERLEAALGTPELRAELTKPLRVVPQFRHLWENCWEAYRRCLPGAPPDGRDPQSEEDLDQRVLYLSGDLPFATPQEISAFIRRSLDVGADYAVGLTTDEALRPFLPGNAGEPGIDVAYFNLREGRYRQNNLHLARPGRLGNRHYIEEMYQHRHQRELGNMLALAWRLLWSEQGGPTILFFYMLLHLAGLFDRWGLRSLADRLRRAVTLPKVEKAVSRLLDTRFRFVATDVGGCALDIDTEHEYDASRARLEAWRAQQAERAEALHGPAPLSARAGGEEA